MKHSYINLLIITCIGIFVTFSSEGIAQCITGAEDNTNHPKRDLRGVFIPTLFNISWPSNAAAAPAVQQAELIAILDDMKANGYNSFFFQVRPAGDAFYDSAIEPWSHWLTGTEGTAPSPYWDPLEFAINEAHARGMDLHAWLNPYRVKYGSYTTASSHVITENPSWTFVDGSNSSRIILDPGLPQVRDYIVDVVEDIASRYDVDGIHFDDYFYPSGGMIATPNNQDATTYANNNPGSLSLANWRRDNVNQMIGMVYDAIQVNNANQNKNVVFGVSPFGIWKSGTPSGVNGTSSYSALYCDPIAWMQQGKVDYIAPQLYWAFGGGQDYDDLSQWWNDQADLYGTQLYISQAYYKMDGGTNWPASFLQDQIDENREASMDATFGQIAYRYNEIDSNLKGINTALNGSQFQYKSFAPPITGTGKDNICPEKPGNVRFGDLKIEWDTPAAASDGDLPQKYVVYAFNNAAQATSNKNDGSKIVDIVGGNELTLTQSEIDNKFFVVTSLDKNNNEAGDSCNTPLNDIIAPCAVNSITAPTAKKNCSGSFTATTTTTFPIEATTVVTWNYDFGGGETFTQEQRVVILDVTPPTAIAQNITVTLVGASITITADDVNNGSSDNCGIQSMSIDKDTFTCKDIGVQPVILTIVDRNGNMATDTAMVTVEGETTEYTGAGWTNSPPTINSMAIFSSDYDMNNASNPSIDACSCEIDSGTTVTVGPGDYLNVDGNITVNGTGSLIVNHTGSVVQNDADATVFKDVNATIEVELTTPVLSNRDFMVMGSPMDGETRNAVFTDAFLVLNNTPANFYPLAGVPVGGTNFVDDKNTNGKWVAAYAGAINPGEGYIVRPQTGYGDPAVTSYDMTYTLGTLNNGDVDMPLTYNGPTDNPTGTPHLLSNPYASPINSIALINDNPLINEVYFWEHLTPPSTSLPGSNNMNFDMDDLSMRNASMALPAPNDPGTSTTPNGVISTGQGFAVKAQGAGFVSFTNSMRLTSGNTTLRNNEELINKLTLEVRNAEYGVGSYSGLAFNPNATEGLDDRLDTQRLATIVSLFSHLQNGTEQLGIQTMPEFENGMKIPFGFTTQVPAELEFVISIAQREGIELENTNVYLIDNLLGTITNLTQTGYSFKSDKQTYEGRFTLQFEAEVLGVHDVFSSSVAFYPNPTEDILNIVSPKAGVNKVAVHDIAGRKIREITYSNETQITLDLSQVDAAIYFVTVSTNRGTVTKRVIKK